MRADGAAGVLWAGRRIRAVLFDLDGTLYHQLPLRTLMLMELSTLLLGNPVQSRKRWRALRAYRTAHEDLRREGCHESVAAAQLTRAAGRADLSVSEVQALITEWMVDRPLKYLRWCRARGLIGLLDALDLAGVRSGVLSDYPPALKLRALGLADRFSLQLCSTDPDIDALKPNPRGVLRACEHWQLAPAEVLVVGDRTDVDAAAAIAAGTPCAIIGRRPAASTTSGFLALSSIRRLHRVLNPGF